LGLAGVFFFFLLLFIRERVGTWTRKTGSRQIRAGLAEKWDASFGTRKTRGSEAVTWQDDVAESGIRNKFHAFVEVIEFQIPRNKFHAFVEVIEFQIPL
jgi:hypothetical protein